MVLFHHIDCPVSLGPATVLEGKNLLTVMRHLKHTIKKNQTNANAVGVLLCKPFQGTNAFSVINDYASSRADRHRQPQQRKVIQMQPVGYASSQVSHLRGHLIIHTRGAPLFGFWKISKFTSVDHDVLFQITRSWLYEVTLLTYGRYFANSLCELKFIEN